jgi:hypothetical protein
MAKPISTTGSETGLQVNGGFHRIGPGMFIKRIVRSVKQVPHAPVPGVDGSIHRFDAHGRRLPAQVLQQRLAHTAALKAIFDDDGKLGTAVRMIAVEAVIGQVDDRAVGIRCAGLPGPPLRKRAFRKRPAYTFLNCFSILWIYGWIKSAILIASFLCGKTLFPRF